MTVKEMLETNALLVLIVISASVAGATFGIVNYFNAQELDRLENTHEAKMFDLESQLASIDRDLPGIPHINIRELLVGENQQVAIDSGLEFFEADRFYAKKSDSYWQYAETDALTFNQEFLEFELPPILLPDLKAYSENVTLHLWRDQNKQRVNFGTGSQTIFPHIVLEKIPLDFLAKIIGRKKPEPEKNQDQQEPDSKELESLENPRDYLKAANKMLYKDAAAIYFLIEGFNQYRLSLINAKLEFRIKKLQKLGPILYCQFVEEYTDVLVDGETMDFYVQREFIIVSKKENLLYIRIFLPSREPTPRAKDFAHVNRWLSQLKLLHD